MKVSCLQENFTKGLNIVGRAVATKTTLPITNNVLLAAEQSRLKLTATNLEMAITCWIGAKVEEEGAITIPARLLNEFVNTLPNERIDLNLSYHTLELRCARFEARVSGMDPTDFPPIPKITDGITAQVDPEALRVAISHVAFATASEDTRPILTGVHVEMENDLLTLAAADGFRLAVYNMPLAKHIKEKGEFNVPGRVFTELQRLLGDQDEPVKLAVNPAKGQAVFHLKNIEVVSQLLQGSFPNYSQLIPQTHTTEAVVTTADFLRATKPASIFARDGSGIVRLNMDPGEGESQGKMVISGRSEQIGDNLGEIDAQVQGESSKIAFNGKYLIDVLAALRESQVVLETSTPSSAGVIRPIGSDNYVHVIMPMFVQW